MFELKKKCEEQVYIIANVLAQYNEDEARNTLYTRIDKLEASVKEADIQFTNMKLEDVMIELINVLLLKINEEKILYNEPIEVRDMKKSSFLPSNSLL